MRILNDLIRHLMPGVIRPLRVLWNEVIGFIFLVLALIIGFSTWRRMKQFAADGTGMAVLIVSVLFVLLLTWFGVSSFLRARKISRS